MASINSKILSQMGEQFIALRENQIYQNDKGDINKLSYSSHLNPCFLEHLDLFKSTKRFILIRDGVIPILEFFLKNPDPDFYEYSLILPLVSRFFVPQQWQERIIFYENVNNNPVKSKKHLSLYFSKENEIQDESILFNELKEIKSDNNFLSVQLNQFSYLPTTNDSFVASTLLSQKVFKIFDQEIIAGESLEKISIKKDLSSYGIFNFIQPKYIYDSYLFHFFGSRNCSYYQEREFEGGFFVEFAQGYGQELFPVESFKDELGVMFSQIREAIGAKQITTELLSTLLSI